jgi:ribokinase
MGQALRALGVPTVIITLGAEGVLLQDATGVQRMPAYPVQAIDTTAAGDAFAGALAVALAEGKGIEAAVQFAQRAAALSVTRLGAQPSLPYRAEVEE